MLKQYRIDITEHYLPFPGLKGTYWVAYGKIEKDSIVIQGDTIPEIYQNLSDALNGLAVSHRKEDKS